MSDRIQPVRTVDETTLVITMRPANQWFPQPRHWSGGDPTERGVHPPRHPQHPERVRGVLRGRYPRDSADAVPGVWLRMGDRP